MIHFGKNFHLSSQNRCKAAFATGGRASVFHPPVSLCASRSISDCSLKSLRGEVLPAVSSYLWTAWMFRWKYLSCDVTGGRTLHRSWKMSIPWPAHAGLQLHGLASGPSSSGKQAAGASTACQSLGRKAREKLILSPSPCPMELAQSPVGFLILSENTKGVDV